MQRQAISFLYLIFLIYLTITIGNGTPKFRNFQPIRSSLESQISIESLTQKLDQEKYPIFEFRQEIEILLKKQQQQQQQQLQQEGEGAGNHGGSDGVTLEIENLLQKYLYNLRNHYFQEFTKRFDEHLQFPLNPLNSPQSMKKKTLKEFEVAMKRSIPVVMNETSFSSVFLAELKYDIDEYIDSNTSEELKVRLFADISFLSNEEFEEGKRKPELKGFKGFLAKVFTKQRLKWIAGQLLLLAFNIAQTEIQMWLARRETDKRLDEIPEFPLL